MLYTIVPLELVFGDCEFGAEPGTLVAGPSPGVPALTEATVSGVKMQVARTGPGRGRVVRLLTTRPSDYLRPELQPGSEVTWES